MARGSVQTRDEGCVFVAELTDEDDSGRFSGLFAAHWEGDSDRGFQEGPEGVSVDEAIRWGRRQAPMVLVRFELSVKEKPSGQGRSASTPEAP